MIRYILILMVSVLFVSRVYGVGYWGLTFASENQLTVPQDQAAHYQNQNAAGDQNTTRDDRVDVSKTSLLSVILGREQKYKYLTVASELKFYSGNIREQHVNSGRDPNGSIVRNGYFPTTLTFTPLVSESVMTAFNVQDRFQLYGKIGFLLADIRSQTENASFSDLVYPFYLRVNGTTIQPALLLGLGVQKEINLSPKNRIALRVGYNDMFFGGTFNFSSKFIATYFDPIIKKTRYYDITDNTRFHNVNLQQINLSLIDYF